MSAYAAETLHDLNQEMATARGRVSQIIAFTCQALSTDERRDLTDTLHDYIYDQYHHLVAPLEAELDEAASYQTHVQGQADTAEYHDRVL